MPNYVSTDPDWGLTPEPSSEKNYVSTDPNWGADESIGAKVGHTIQRVGDVAISGAKGVIGWPQAIVGISDLATGGRSGKAVEDSGIRFKEAQDILNNLKSPEQKLADSEVANAQGFTDTVGAAIQNPSTIVNSVAESLPAMGGGGLIARGGLAGIGALSRAAAKKAGPWMAGVGEGAITSGQIAEQVRSENADKLLSDKQALASGAAGLVTGGIGAAAAKLVNTKFGRMLGLHDLDLIIVNGGPDAIPAKAAKLGYLKSLASSGFSEGVLEEMPQSAQEQMWQNYAQGKPITEGVGNAAATGMLAGAAMGGAGGGYNNTMAPKAERDPNQLGDIPTSSDQDTPTPEPEETIAAQVAAFSEGRKPAILLTPGEKIPSDLPPGSKTADIPGHGTLIYKDDKVLQLALSGRLGSALGYGIDQKPDGASQVVTARDQNGTVIQDVATDGGQQVIDAAAMVAGDKGSVEQRGIVDALNERHSTPQQPQSTLTGLDRLAELDLTASDRPLTPDEQQERATLAAAEYANDTQQEPTQNDSIPQDAQLNTGTDGNPVAEQPATDVSATGVPEDANGGPAPLNHQADSALPDNQGLQVSNDQTQQPAGQTQPVSPDTGANQTGVVAPAGNGQEQSAVPAQTQQPLEAVTDANHPSGSPAQVGIGAAGGNQESQAANSPAGSPVEHPVPGLDAGGINGNGAGVQRNQPGQATADSNQSTGALNPYQLPDFDHTKLNQGEAKKMIDATDRIKSILSEAPTRSKVVADSLMREADKLHQQRLEIANKHSRQAQAPKPARNNLTAPPTGSEELQTAIRKLGGIQRTGHADRAGFSDYKGRKYTGLFNNGRHAKTLDEMAELLREHGFQIDGENDLIEKLYGSLNGQPHYTAKGFEQHMEKVNVEQQLADQQKEEYDRAEAANDEEAKAERAAIIDVENDLNDDLGKQLADDIDIWGIGGRQLTDAEAERIFGTESADQKDTGAVHTGTTVQNTVAGDEQHRGSGAAQAKADSNPAGSSDSAKIDEQRDQGNEQASGGISVAGQKAAERFKENPQKIINNLVASSKISDLYDAAGVMTSSAFKALPKADQTAAYVKMVTGETIPGAPKAKGKPIETDLFVNSEEERKALETKQGVANVAAAKDAKRQGDGKEPPPLFSDNAALAGQEDIEDIAKNTAKDEKNSAVSNRKFTQDEFNRNRYFTETPGVTVTAMSGRKYDGYFVGHTASGFSSEPLGSMDMAYDAALKSLKQKADIEDAVKQPSNTQATETKASSEKQPDQSSNGQEYQSAQDKVFRLFRNLKDGYEKGIQQYDETGDDRILRDVRKHALNQLRQITDKDSSVRIADYLLEDGNIANELNWIDNGDIEEAINRLSKSQSRNGQANDKRQSEDSKKADSNQNQIPASWENPTIEDDGRWFGTVIEKKPEFKKEQPTQGTVHRVYKGSSTGIIEFQPDGTDSIFRLRPDQIAKVIKLVDNKSTGEVPEKSAGEVDQASLDQERFKDNKIFTADKAAAARAILKSKLGTLNSGFDPELAMAGLTLAGCYIESGAKSFADYTKAMIADLGEGVKPYLRSFYESVRAYPGMDKSGMTNHAELDAADRYGIHHGEMWSFNGKPAREVKSVNEHYIGFASKDDAGKYDVSIGNFSQQKDRWQKVDDNSGKENSPIEKPAPVIGDQPKVEKQKFDPVGNLKLKSDWGVEHIDGYDSDRDDGKGGKIKTEFLNNTKKYLNQVSDLLAKEGFSPYTDKKGKTEKPVSANEGGPAVSGDVSLAMRKGNNGVYIQVGVSSVRVNGKSHPQGVAMVARVTNNADKGRYATDGINQWLPWDASTADLAKWAITQVGRLEDNAKFKEEQDHAKRPQNAEQAPVETGNGEEDRSPWGDSQPDSGSMGGGMAEANQKTGITGSTDSGSQKASGARAGSGRVRAPKQLDGRNRSPSDSGRRSEPGAAKYDSVSLPSEPKADFTATAETAEAITEGGQKTKARANIAAIKLVKQLVAEDRRATMDEQKTLARYVGWGGIKQIFDADNTAWSSLRNELKAILTAEEYAAANRSILDAHYTGLDVVNGIWGIAKHLGFKGGRLLEPSMGVGNFFGAMPHDMRVNSTLFGVELDNITGAIAKYLYPNARINTPVGFQEVDIPANSFDFATGNPPFGEHSLYDKNHPEFRSFAIHQFFFAKTLNTLRPGGIQAFVVSRYLMDSRDGNGFAARKYLSENARLVGAMRLPYDAFLSNANTEVVTDIIILQKLAPGEQGNANDWTSMTDINVVHPDGTPSTFSINKYFADHPEMVLGSHSNTGKMRAKYQYNVEPISGESLQFSIEKATKRLPKDIYKSAEKPLVELATQADEVPEGTKVYGFFVDGDTVMQRVPDSMGNRQSVQVEFKDAKSPARAKGLIQLRDALRDLMRTELSRAATNKEIEAKRATLNKMYDAFVKEHGFINRDVNRRVMRDDPDYPLLESLEPGYDPGLGFDAARKKGEKERKPSAEKADIFRERVLYPFQTLDKAETAKDALIASLNEKGGVDQDFMADIYGKPWESIESELGDLIYQNPAGGYETADAYLSGNVKAKLRLAEESAKENSVYQRNVEALKAVQPADIPALKISVRLGSPWVDGAAMADFAKEIFGKNTKANIRFVPQIAKWMVGIEDFDPVARVSVWGTQRMPANELLEHILNNKPIVVKDNLGTSREPEWVVNETETESARAKAQDMSAKFKEWIWQDQERRDRLAKIYNQNYNTDKRRSYDGSHLTLPRSSNNIQLRPHQKNAIWRALQDRTILLDQVVGAGKTFIMAGIAMEMRRLGIARKPMFMVPNSLVRQWRDEFYKLYPNANVLAATESDFSKVNRKRFMAKVATGDWDAVVVAHSSFKKIGMPEAQERKILDDQLKEIADAIEEMKRERGDKNVMRDMQRIKEKLEEKLKALNDRGGKKDDTVSFDELGVDALFLDEAHLFKNLFYISGMRNIAGLGNPSGSGRAFDLFVKTQFLAENYAGKAPIVFATGTPVSNSLVEMFTMQRYLAWSKLKDANIHLLDAWAGVYGDVQNVYEVHPSGTGYRLSTRFAKFVNLPSLMNLYRGFADIITMDDLKKQAIDRGEKFPVPKVKGGKPTLVIAPRSDLQTKFFGEPEFVRDEGDGIQFKYNDSPKTYDVAVDGSGKWSVIKAETKGSSISQKYDTKEEAEEDLRRGLVTPEVAWNENSILWKFENLKRLTKETNGKINALSITNEARKAGLDYRLINPSAPDFKDSKINKAVDNVLRIYKDWTKDKGTQLVFCDLSVPQSAKAAAASSERDAFVRREDGNLRKVKATIAQIDGMDRAFLVVKMGKKDETRFMVYDGVTGADLEIEGATRAEAVKALADASNNDLSFADKFEQFAPIEDSDIADWKDSNSKEEGDDEEGDGAISMDELLSMGSTNKFSVYDDIKAKLISKGIPEKEIAFIHDYDTAVKKGKLFDLVNAGDIRVLIGSTEKMGAGMNVQKRLVGLHHLDAPWRPSDLEQREGRIIRQGNELYKRDPDNFEVEIMRYGTKQTYDTRMWQIIEHKAAGVEQLRKANDDMLEIDDVGGEAANAADMKAAASGNPLILDEIKLRNEVKSLEAQQFGHMQAQVELQDRLKDAQKAPQVEREKLAGIKPLMDVRDDNPAKPFSFIDANGNDHKDTKEAEAPITKAMIAVAKGSLGTEMVVGKYRGFDVVFERGGFGVNVDLVTKSGHSLPVTTYGSDDKFSISGLFTRIENALEKLDVHVDLIKKNAKDKIDQIPAIEKELGKPFAKEEQLKESRAKHRNVVNQLAKSGGGIELTDAMKKELEAALAARGLGKKSTPVQDEIVFVPGYGPMIPASSSSDFDDAELVEGYGFMMPASNVARKLSNDQIKYSRAAPEQNGVSEPSPSLVQLFERLGKTPSKAAPAIDHPQAELIKAVQDHWQDVLLDVGYEKTDKSDNQNGKVFIQC